MKVLVKFTRLDPRLLVKLAKAFKIEDEGNLKKFYTLVSNEFNEAKKGDIEKLASVITGTDIHKLKYEWEDDKTSEYVTNFKIKVYAIFDLGFEDKAGKDLDKFISKSLEFSK